MDVATDVGATGADSAVPYAVEVTAPADTPAALSSHDAAAVLRKLRRKTTDTTTEPARATPAASAVTTESTAAPRIKSGDAEDTAPVDGKDGRERPDAAQDPGEKTEGTDPAADEPPPIEPPRSWTKEDKELFASLPRATQERLAERERLRESDFLRRQNEAAEKLKGLSAREQAVEQARQHYEAALPQLLATLQSQQAGEFADIKSMADVERLAREDWPRYLLWDLQQKKIAEVGQQLLTAQHRQVVEKLAQFTDFAKREDDLFKEKVPDMADEAKAAELQKKALAVLGDLGFDEAELARSWNGERDLSLRDHRVQLLIRDATLWREAQAKAKAATARPVPPVQRPGAAPSQGAASEAQIQALSKRLESTGSL